MKVKKQIISIPQKTLRNLLEASRDFGIAQEALEDYLQIKDYSFVQKLKQARREHISWNVIKFDFEYNY